MAESFPVLGVVGLLTTLGAPLLTLILQSRIERSRNAMAMVKELRTKRINAYEEIHSVLGKYDRGDIVTSDLKRQLHEPEVYAYPEHIEELTKYVELIEKKAPKEELEAQLGKIYESHSSTIDALYTSKKLF